MALLACSAVTAETSDLPTLEPIPQSPNRADGPTLYHRGTDPVILGRLVSPDGVPLLSGDLELVPSEAVTLVLPAECADGCALELRGSGTAWSIGPLVPSPPQGWVIE